MTKSSRVLSVVAGLLLCVFALGAADAWAQAGPIGSSVQQYGGPTRRPDVAYDTTNHVYLIVWGPYTIRGVFVNDDGVAVSGVFQISDNMTADGFNYAQQPRAAFNPDTGSFLVVWHSTDGVTTYRDGARVRGRTVSFTGGVSTAPTQVYSNGVYTTRWEMAPAIAYATGSKRFLVAFTIGPETYGRLADSAGAAIGTEFSISASSPDDDRDTAVGYFPGTDRFAVTWVATGTGSDYVKGRLFSAPDGSSVGSTFLVAAAGIGFVPELAYNPTTGQMFATWIQFDSASSGDRPFGRYFDENGTMTSAPTRLSSIVGSSDANSVAYNTLSQSFFLVTHYTGSVQDYGVEVSGAGAPLASAVAVTSVPPTATGAFNPRIAASNAQARWVLGTAVSFGSLWSQLIGTGGITYRLSLASPIGGTVTGGGITCGTGGTTCSVTFGGSTSVTLTATADTNYAFTGWGGSCSGTSPTTTIQVDGSKSCTATFTPTTTIYQLNVTKPAGGTVSGGGIVCGSAGSQCQVTFDASTPVTLSATPAAGFSFVNWGGNCSGTAPSTTIQVDGVKTCTASFTDGTTAGPPYTMTISPKPTGGTVTGAGLNCGDGGALCTASMPAPMAYGMTATAASGYTFAGWTGNCSGTSTSLYINLAGPRVCGAVFVPVGTVFSLTTAIPTGGTITGGGITCGVGGAVCQATYQSATTVTLTATPASGYNFTSWGGSCSGTASTATVLVDGVRACSATFTAGPVNGPPYTITITPRPTGGTVTGAGLNCGVNGTLCTASMPAPMAYGMSATPAAGYTFGGWTGDCTGTNPSLYVNLAGPRTCGATFTPVGTVYQLTVSPAPTGGTVSGGGITCGTGGAACSVTFGASTPVTLTATPDAGYTFTSWGGACAGTSTTTAVQVDGAKTCTATFAAIQTYQLTVSPVPTGGTVSGGGITCGTGGAACSVTFGASTPVTLTATPTTGYTFASWGGSCAGTAATTTVQVDAVKTCSATFTSGVVNGPPYTMTISPRPTGGTVTGAGLNCGPTSALCTASMPAPMPYGMSATPAAGYTFGGWTGDCTGTNPSLYVNLAGPRTCGATFTPVGTVYQLTVSPAPTGGTVSGGGITCGTGGAACSVTFGASTPVTLTATPDAGYTFTSWGGACAGTSTTTAVQVDGAKTCTATFAAIQTYQLTVSPVPTGGTVSGGGITCGTGGAACSVTFGASTPVTLTATPATGYTFASWGGSCAGTAATTTVQVDAVKTCSATFTSGVVNGPPYTMTISPRPTGGTVTGAGLNCGPTSALCTASMPAPMPYGMSATPAAGYTFTGWTGDCTGTSPSLYVNLAGPRTCGATFTPVGTVYQLTVSPAPTGGTVSGGGITCGTGGAACSVTFGASTPVTLTATPDAGYTFTSWGGACAGTSTTTAVQVDGAKTCTATFAAIQTYQLTVSPVPTGGTVSGGGITCGTGGAACSVTFGASTPVTLTATPATGYTFASWGGSCAGTAATTTVQVDAVKTCSATFTSGVVNGPPYTMTISPRPTGGTVTGAGLNCGPTSALCTASMPAPMPYGMSATPAAGYTFGGWTGDCAGTNPSLYINLAGPRTCGATFNPVGGGAH